MSHVNESLDLSAASAAALADFAAAPDTPPAAAPAAAVVEPGGAPEPPAAAAPATGATPPPADAPAADSSPTDERVYEFERKGTTVRVSANDEAKVKELLSKGYDYTEKTMDFAEERRQWERQAHAAEAALITRAQQIQQAEARLHQLFNNPAELQRLAHAELAQQGLPSDPNEVMTVQQAGAFVQRALEAERQQLLSEVEMRVNAAQVTTYEQQYASEIDQHAATLLERFPILRDDDDISMLLINDARKQRPKSILEVKQLMAESAEQRAAKRTKRVQDHEKMAVARFSKTQTPTMEPPGGAPHAITPAPIKFKLGSPELTAQVIADLSGKR